MVWSYWIVNTMTGEKQLEVRPDSGTCRTSLTGVGSGEHTFRLRDASDPIPRATVRDLFLSWIRTLVVCWDDQPVYAGVIVGGRWNRSTGVLTVRHRELRAILSKRFGWKVTTYPTVTGLAWNWKVTGKSLRGLVRAVAQRMFLSVPGDNWHLPVVLPADESGSKEFEEWAFNLRSGEQMLSDLQDTDGGPDVYLRPRWSSSSKHEWVLDIGSPLLSGGTVERVIPAVDGGVLDYVVDLDASDQWSGAFALGEGSEQDMKVGLAGSLPGTPIPDMDTKFAAKGAATTASAFAQAMGRLRTNREAIRQDTKQILAGDMFPVGVGGTVLDWLDADEFLDDGYMTGYIIGFTARVGSDVLEVEVQ